MVCVMGPPAMHTLRARALSRLRGESGIALVMAIGIMFVLTITLGTVIFFTSASVRHANRSNAGQKAYALAEAGFNNALAVLNAHYPTDPNVNPYPGDTPPGTLLPTRTTTFNEGTATWSGTLVKTTTSLWPWEWQIISVGKVTNPTGPGAADVTRTIRAAVPVVIPPHEPASASSPLNWIYALHDATFANSVTIASPVYTQHNLTLDNTASISYKAQKLAVGGALNLLKNANVAGSSSNRLAEAHIFGGCRYKGNGDAVHPCQWDADNVFVDPAHRDYADPATVAPPLISPTPALTCCSPVGGSVDPPPASGQSQMGFWYQNSMPGPNFPCDPVTAPEKLPSFSFDTGDNTINNSATPGTAIDLTPAQSYTCKIVRAGTTVGELSWNASTNVLTTNGTMFIDGSATVSNTTAKYSGRGTIYLSGTFLMDNHAQLCAISSSCVWDKKGNPPTDWDPNPPNGNALIIVADGDGLFGGAQSQVSTGNGIEIKTATFQGVLIANKNIVTLTTTNEQGPMISVYHDVQAGQTGEVTFPAVNFAPSGGGGVVGPPPPAQLLTPQNISGG
jgi:Tfp pilus assembly protein PilX